MEYADQMAPQVAALPFSLVLFAAVTGVAMALLFRLASRPAAIRSAKRRAQAQFLALRLFADEPAVVWRAQMRLLAANVRYLGVLLVPTAAAAVPFILAFPQLEALYGRVALRVGSETVLTVRMERGGAQPVLETPPGLHVETPGVDAASETSWELLVTGPVSGPVHIRTSSSDVTKNVAVGSGSGYLDEKRSAGLLAWWRDPGEGRIHSPGVDWVRVAYRKQRFAALGMEWGWEVWFLSIAMLAAPVASTVSPARFRGMARRAAG